MVSIGERTGMRGAIAPSSKRFLDTQAGAASPDKGFLDARAGAASFSKIFLDARADSAGLRTGAASFRE